MRTKIIFSIVFLIGTALLAWGFVHIIQGGYEPVIGAIILGVIAAFDVAGLVWLIDYWKKN